MGVVVLVPISFTIWRRMQLRGRSLGIVFFGAITFGTDKHGLHCWVLAQHNGTDTSHGPLPDWACSYAVSSEWESLQMGLIVVRMQLQ